MTERAPTLRDLDSAERLMRARAILFPTAGGLVFGTLVAFYLMETRHLGLGWAAGVVLLGGIAGATLGFVGWAATGRISRGFVGLVTAAGNIRPRPSFSLEESLIVRGKYPEAATAFRAHLASDPGDDDARIALAALTARHLGDPVGAERLYREVIAKPATDHSEWTATNALIDLYRCTDQRGRLMVELARFADRYRHTAAGAAARRELLALKREPS